MTNSERFTIEPSSIDINKPILEQIPQLEPLGKLDGSEAVIHKGDREFSIRSLKYKSGFEERVIFGVWEVKDSRTVPVGLADFELDGKTAVCDVKYFPSREVPKDIPPEFFTLDKIQGLAISDAFGIAEDYRGKDLYLGQTLLALAMATLEHAKVEDVKFTQDKTVSSNKYVQLKDLNQDGLIDKAPISQTSFYSTYSPQHIIEDVDYAPVTGIATTYKETSLPSTHISGMQVSLILESLQ